MKRKRLKPVQLCDVPLRERREAARRLCEKEIDPEYRVLLMLAAECPSDQTYYILEDAA